MANYLEKYNIINSSNFVTYSSRYINSQLYYYGSEKKITFETYKRKTYNIDDSDKFFTIIKGVEYRPDLVSNNFYGTVDYWWKLMQYNGLYDILEFKSGTVIRVPSSLNIGMI